MSEEWEEVKGEAKEVAAIVARLFLLLAAMAAIYGVIASYNWFLSWLNAV